MTPEGRLTLAEGRIRFSAAFAPGPATAEHVALAEELGYERAWLYDSPALYFDVWATLAAAASRTSRIGLATGVAVPRLRHVVATASSVAAVSALSGGRFTLGLGVGFTSAHTLALKPMRWADLISFRQDLVALLAGEAIERDGKELRLMYDPSYLPVLPLEVPVVFGAEGPKGRRAAEQHADGLLTIRADPSGFDWSVRHITGTVLDDGEDPASERVWQAAGHAAATRYHLAYEFKDVVEALPNGRAWREFVAAMPERQRHIFLHQGHVTSVSEHDSRYLPREAVAKLTFTGDRAALQARIAKLADRGVTEIAYQPAGPDIRRELTAFAALAGS